jgi:cobalt-precorrin 5A hydrolase
MVRGEAMIVAGIGCRRGCPAGDIVALVRRAGGADALATAAWKHDEPGLAEAAKLLGLILRFVDDEALAAVQDQCPTRSLVVARATGHASIAEAAALAGGGRLVLPRITGGSATCALAEHP